MSLPPELRVLCFQLSTTPASALPRLMPTLLRHVTRCQTALSSPAGNASKADSSASSVQVQVHKLKTQLSTLLNGKSSEGRFAAVLLIKAVIEAGGWEVLRGSEPWVRGLLPILGKPDSAVTKELCIVALTKIYCMTHPYQTLVREITTPTLPAFITSCLNLILSKSSKAQDISSSTIEVVFRSFATLVPRHTSIYRPFVSQIRAVTKPYVAATSLDGKTFVPSSLAESARRLVVLSHLTVTKNAGGEEWGKVVRDLIKDIHLTADLIFRAVVEDWESAAGYVGDSVDINAELSGGAKNIDDLPRWTGIDAGVERMIGLLALLEEYFKGETSMPVSIPLGAIIDMVTRILSIAIPSPSQSSTRQGTARLHPAIDGDEKAALWSGMPQVYIAALEVVSTITDRLQESFMPMALGFLDQLAWVFSSGKHDAEFRSHAYHLTKQLLLLTGLSLGKPSSSKCFAIIRSCCNDVIPVGSKSVFTGPADVTRGKKSNGNTSNANQNADTFLQNTPTVPQDNDLPSNSDLALAARDLLPLFLSHFPQNHLDISLRSLIERAAILSHHRKAMLSSILNPFVGKNGKVMTSILPHLTREFPDEATTEILLRPRMPLVPSTATRLFSRSPEPELGDEDEDEDTRMKMEEDAFDVNDRSNTFDTSSSALRGNVLLSQDTIDNQPGLGISTILPSNFPSPHHRFGNAPASAHTSLPPNFDTPMVQNAVSSGSSTSEALMSQPQLPRQSHLESRSEENLDDDSDDGSVHLTMQLDTDSESEG